MTAGQDDRAHLQTRSEWLRELETGKPVTPSRAALPMRAARLRFDHHRTTIHGRLVLAFVDMDTGEEAVAFFNVSITTRAGGRYRKGVGGQFNPAPRSSFRKFWQGVMGAAPRRWARVHYELHKLRAFTFTADIMVGKREDGTAFLVARSIRLHCTATALGLHRDCTDAAHEPPCTPIEPQPAPALQYSGANIAHEPPSHPRKHNPDHPSRDLSTDS